jgi:hypothetical protein
MYIQKRNVRTVLRNSIAAEDAQPTLTISMETSMMLTIWAVSFKGNELNVQL